MPIYQETCSICGNPAEGNRLHEGMNGKKYCRSCIESLHMVQCSHDRCGKYLRPEEAMISGQGYLCIDHWNDEYSWCSSCGALVRKRYSHALPDGSKICQSCFESSYFSCEDCGEVHPLVECITVEIGGRIKRICRDCRESHYVVCSECGGLCMASSFVQTSYKKKNGEYGEIYSCRACAEKIAHQCSHCGDWFENSMPLHDEETCDRCYYRNEIIHSYGFKPRAVPRKTEDENMELLFGIENEIELKFNDPDRERYEDSDDRSFRISTPSGDFDVDYRRYVAHRIDTSIPGFFYQKNDGSISFGMEIVSHPATLEFWRSQKDNIEELFSFLRNEGCQGDDAGTVGMHIHVSRNKMKRAHQNSFAAFVYSHREKIEKLAGRKSNGYTKMIRLPNSAADSDETRRFERVVINNDDRYSAVNWKNKNTVELRMFQSTLNTNTFLANIEFAHALYHFSKERTVLECVNAESWMNFCTFVSGNGYSFLERMMTEDGIFAGA